MRSRAFLDLIVLVLITTLVLATAAAFDVLKAIVEWTQRYESWELDELLVAMVVLAFLLIPYSYRRWREVRNAISERKHAEEALRASEERYRSLYTRTPGMLHSIDESGRLVEVSDRWLEVLGYERSEVIGRASSEFLTDESRHYAETVAIPQFMKTGHAREIAYQFVKKNGEIVDILLSAVSERDKDGGSSRSFAILTDVTDRKRAEEALRASEAKYRSIFENVQDIFYQTDGTGIITEISPSVTRFGYTREGIIGTSVLDVYEDREERTQLVNALIEHGEVTDYEIRLRTGDGRVIDTSISARLLRNPDGTFAGSEGAIRDISERKEAERELEQALEAERDRSRRDPLTGVLNHAAIVEELRTLVVGDDAGHHAVVMIDVDGLKAMNDSYGHQAGDEALVAVATVLTRDGAIVGRYGGDEFVVALPGADRRAAETYCDLVSAKLANVRITDADSDTTVPVQASLGLAVYPEDAATVKELIKLSDSAMYTAKRQRAAGPEGRTLSRYMRNERAAEVLSDILPLLTAPGAVEDKLRLISQRLSAGAGYDAVDFTLFAAEPGTPLANSTFAHVPEELVEGWIRGQRSERGSERHPIRSLLERTRRPLILDDPWNDDLLWESQRAILRAAELKSVLVAPMIWEGDVIGSLGVANRDEHAFGPADAQFLAAVATQVTAIVRMALFVDELQSSAARLSLAHEETVLLLAAVAEAHDETTGAHLQSVRALTEALAGELGYGEEDASATGLAAVLHDIGKIRVPNAVLGKTGLLAGDEWELMKQHTTWGTAFLTDRPGFELAATIACCHHERWDGSGYPDGLAGDAIPEAATIVTVADAFDAMVSDRPYRAHRPIDEAVQEIVACSGSQFNPKVVEALLRLQKRNALPLKPIASPGEQAA